VEFVCGGLAGRAVAGGVVETAGFAFLVEVPFDRGFSFLLLGFLFLPDLFFDRAVPFFVIELVEIIRFSLHVGGFAVLQQ
jgi:hypothetical protein